MHKVDYPQLDEVVYYETLDNGLQVVLIPKNDFAKTYGIMTTNFGSIDNHFVPMHENEAIIVPDGVAHFLEHKLFEGEERDAFEDFAELGSSANAFTSFTRTSYLFSATSKVAENVQTLLDFVQSPHFTAEGTEKEKGIIAQEINMYEDQPDWRQFYGLLKNLYPTHPLSIDIAGTVASIQEITPEILQTCYDTFYHPSNMNVVVIGNFNPDEMIEVIKENQNKKEFPKEEHVIRLLPAENIEDIVPYAEMEMDVKRSKVSLGVKGIATVPEGNDVDLAYLKGSLFMELLFGRGSENFIDLYDAGLIDDSFSYSYSIDRSFHFMSVETDTDEPKKVDEALKRILLNWKTDAGVTKENFELLKRAFIGEQLQAFNSLEYISNQYGYLFFTGIELFNRIERIESLTLEDVLAFAEPYINEHLMSTFVIKPKKGKSA
ncbi:EF-P 5-aminopentanol modification-associated protein YfmH [Jeotgalibaca caeni]|uniref:EF-P 5-aminopentanol modification-associated protein YfmH n=1 Tax=Jeotgalibaca caeni TaxID=3028623 RepID=UPI00237D95B0|nr:pitrilysin family protein [Jeotgalibaca caeni]MDE1548955.1 pitrilysin family protein [Jeotgalibaca caeni]